MIGPTYVHVLEGHRALRVTICRRSQGPQIVRIEGAGRPSKVSTIEEFPNVEVRPNQHHPIDVGIPAQVSPLLAGHSGLQLRQSRMERVADEIDCVVRHQTGVARDMPGQTAPSLDDVTVKSEAIEQRGGHLCIGEDASPFKAG